MKMRANWLLISAVALGLGACKNKQEVKAPETPATVAETPAKEVPAPPAPEVKPATISAAERAAKLGFVKHLPQDTEVVVAYYNGTKTASRVKSSKLWKLIQTEVMGESAIDETETSDEAEEAADPNVEPKTPDAAATEDPAGPAALFANEVTLALGKTTGEQAGNLLNLNRRVSYFQMRELAKAFAAVMKSGDSSDLLEAAASGYGPELAKDLIKDPQSGIASLEKAKMPPIYLAFKAKDSDRTTAADQVKSMIGNIKDLGEMVEPVTLEAAGQKFEGSKILGSKISAMMAEDREEMVEAFDAATVDQLLAAVAKKDIIVVSGTLGDYIVVFIGGSADDFKLTGDLGQSLAAADTLAFSDGYATKELGALVYGQKGAMDTLIKSAGGISDMVHGLRDGIAGAEGLGDTRDLEAMLQIVVDREAALRKLSGTESLGTVAFFEDGLKIESFGGTDSGAIDWKTPNKLSHLGNSEDVLLFANTTLDATFDKASREYLEALMETGYTLAMKVVEAPLENEDLAQYKEMAKLFDSKFRPDLIALWDTLSEDLSNGIGKERALIVDLKGSAPAIPDMPQALVDKAKLPRVTLLTPVTDRAKLSGSWDKTNTILTGSLAKISEMAGEEIPMLKPSSSEKNGNTTWFFQHPLFTDDFLPSVTVGDKWFAASTSKIQANDLIAKADAGGGESRNGFWFSMNFKTLEKYADETLKLVAENAEGITGAPLEEDDKKNLKDAINILSDLDKLTVHSRREGAVLRSSVHFKTR